MNNQQQLSAILAAENAGNDDRCLELLAPLTPNQVVSLMDLDRDERICVILWSLAPHWAYAALYAEHARNPEAGLLSPDRVPPPEQLHHDRPLSECDDYTPHYCQWMTQQVELHALAKEFAEQTATFESEIAKADQSIANLSMMVEEGYTNYLAPLKDWTQRREELIAMQRESQS